MPRTKKIIKEEVPQKEVVSQETLDKLIGALESLNNRLFKLENIEKKIEVKDSITSVENAIPQVPKIPMPEEYTEVVYTTLNQNFIARLEPDTGGTFKFTIVTPKQYSNFNEDQWKFFKEQLHTKVIPITENILGVREWCERVFSSFDSDIRAKIVADRNVNVV